MRLPKALQYHWATEYVRYWAKATATFAIPQIGLEIDIHPDQVAIDCGANVGVITSKLARTGATVYAFEPNPHCFSILKRRFMTIPRVHCINAGVMDKRCTSKFSVPGPHGPFDMIGASCAGTFDSTALNANAYSIDEIEVECIDLSEFISALGRPVRFLKLDIEGSEIAVLHRLIDSGAVDAVDLIAVETHERHMPHLLQATNILRERIKRESLDKKIRLDWP